MTGLPLIWGFAGFLFVLGLVNVVLAVINGWGIWRNRLIAERYRDLFEQLEKARRPGRL